MIPVCKLIIVTLLFTVVSPTQVLAGTGLRYTIAVESFENRSNAENWAARLTVLLNVPIEVLVSAPNWSALTVAEVNPDHGAADGSTMRMFAQALADALGRSPVLV